MNMYNVLVHRMFLNRMCCAKWGESACSLLFHWNQVRFRTHTNLYNILHIALHSTVQHTNTLEYERWIKWNFFHCLAIQTDLICNTHNCQRFWNLCPRTCSIMVPNIFSNQLFFCCSAMLNNLSVYWNFNVRGKFPLKTTRFAIGISPKNGGLQFLQRFIFDQFYVLIKIVWIKKSFG